MSYTKRDREARILEDAEALIAAGVDWENPPPFRQWAKENLWIRPRGDDITGKKSKKNLIPFSHWTHGQEELGEYLETCRLNQQPIDCTVHKSRQHSGISTVALAFLFYLVTFYPEKAAAFVTHLDDSSIEVFKNCDRFYRKLPPEWKRPLKGGKVKKDGLDYEDPHNSSIAVGTAGTKDILRGPNLHYGHFSEMDFWPSPETTWGGLAPSLPEEDETWDRVVIRESTAKGKGYYYEQCQIAQDPDSGIKFFFFSWIDEPRCRTPLAPGETFVLDAKEVEYRENIRANTISEEHPNGQMLDDEQMKWARIRRIRKCGGSWEVFHQEYPAYSELAFLYSGRPWFSQERVNKDIQNAPAPIWQGRISYSDDTLVEQEGDPYGPLKIWKYPETGRTYCVAMDTGLGVGSDYTEIIAFDAESFDMCLHYRNNRVKPEHAASVGWLIGMWYHCAFLIVEAIDGSGMLALGTLSRGSDERYPWLTSYPNLYFQQSFDKETREITKRLGFRSSHKVKEATLSRFAEYYDAGLINIPSLELLKQMEGLAWDADKEKWPQNYQDPVSGLPNDDGIMCYAIGLYCLTEAPEKHGRVKIRRLGW